MWNSDHSMDKSLSIVILPFHPLKQYLLIPFPYFCIISSGHGNPLSGNRQLGASHALYMVHIYDKTLMAAQKYIPAYLPLQIV